MKELIVPPEVETDPNALEIARIWVAHKAQHVSLNTGPWEKAPAGWGIMLCDLARHVANAYEQGGHGKAHDIFNSIVDMFNAEANSPTDEVAGILVSKH